MGTQAFSFSDRAIKQLPLAEKGQYMVRDSDLKGFYLIVGTGTKSFVAQAEYWNDGERKSKRLVVGNADEMSVREARIAAKGTLAKIASGQVHREEAEAKAVEQEKQTAETPEVAPPAAAKGVTLRQAWERYRVSHLERKGRSEATIAGYKDHVERLMLPWLDKPLQELGDAPELVADQHDKITRENGPSAGNGAMRTLRAIYNHARRRNRDLPPENPTVAVDWNVEKRRDTAMGVEDLPGWFEEARRLRHPIRREFHLFTLLSGSRPAALLRARIEHLNLRDRVLHIPRPKGGADKAFDIPLSRAMILCLIRAIRAGRMLLPDQAREWIFAGEGQEGHMVAHKEPRRVLSKYGNDLRQTFRTVGQAAGLSEIDMHLLMNHSLPGVNAGYITRAKLLGGHLRKTQEDLSTMMLKHCGASRQQWPRLPSRKIGDPLLDPTPPNPRSRAHWLENPLTIEGRPRMPTGRASPRYGAGQDSHPMGGEMGAGS